MLLSRLIENMKTPANRTTPGNDLSLTSSFSLVGVIAAKDLCLHFIIILLLEINDKIDVQPTVYIDRLQRTVLHLFRLAKNETDIVKHTIPEMVFSAEQLELKQIIYLAAQIKIDFELSTLKSDRNNRASR